MIPIDFEGTNIEFTKPSNMTDEECMSVRAFKGVDMAGFEFILVAWQPNFDDIKAIQEGRPIMLKVVGTALPPHAIYTYDENFEPNI